MLLIKLQDDSPTHAASTIVLELEVWHDDWAKAPHVPVGDPNEAGGWVGGGCGEVRGEGGRGRGRGRGRGLGRGRRRRQGLGREGEQAKDESRGFLESRKDVSVGLSVGYVVYDM